VGNGNSVKSVRNLRQHKWSKITVEEMLKSDSSGNGHYNTGGHGGG